MELSAAWPARLAHALGVVCVDVADNDVQFTGRPSDPFGETRLPSIAVWALAVIHPLQQVAMISGEAVFDATWFAEFGSSIGR